LAGVVDGVSPHRAVHADGGGEVGVYWVTVVVGSGIAVVTA
jgi:hypothetical protein